MNDPKLNNFIIKVLSNYVIENKIKYIIEVIDSLNTILIDIDIKYLKELYMHKPISWARPQGL